MALAVAGTAAFTGCGGDAQPTAPLPPEDRLSLAVVALDALIGGDRVASSGVVINAEEGLVLTSAHSVWGARSLRVMTGLGVLYGRIVARAPCSDLALVETQPRLPGLVALEPADRPPSRTALLSALGRREADAAIGTTTLLRIPTRVTASGVKAGIDPALGPLRGAMRLEGALVPESSGGPVLDAKNRLVALAIGTEAGGRRAAVAVPWAQVRARLDELQPDDRRINVGWRDQYRCANRMHAYARTHHEGFRPIDAQLDAPVPATRLPGTERLDAE